MKTFLQILLYSMPVAFIVLSRFYMIKQRKLQNSGRIPDIVNAGRYQQLFFALSVLTAVVIVVSV